MCHYLKIGWMRLLKKDGNYRGAGTMNKYNLNERDLRLAHELADLYYWMDADCRVVNGGDKERLYKEITRNIGIHWMALELVEARFRKKYRRSKK